MARICLRLRSQRPTVWLALGAMVSCVGFLSIALQALLADHAIGAPPPAAAPPRPKVHTAPPPPAPVPPPQNQTPPPQNPPPQPASPSTPHAAQVTPEQLGRAVFFDDNLSNPAGMSCATCHAPAAGFTYPDSTENLKLGPVEGVVSGRFGNRKPPTVSYAAFLPTGPNPVQFGNGFQAFVGGMFWDGRASDLLAQAAMPFVNPNEMNDIVHNVGAPELVVAKVAQAPYARQFVRLYGPGVFNLSTTEAFQLICATIVAYEKSTAVSPFNSRYDAVLSNRDKFTASEMNGLRLVTGSVTGRPGGPPSARTAQCFLCHSIPTTQGAGPDLFTNSVFANTGIPKNPNNPFYTQTDAVSNPLGYNPAGAAFIDLGLGGFLYPKMGLPAGNMGAGSDGQGDFLHVNGAFKTPTLRNVDKRPTPGFVKAYGHNGVFKNLKDVVHFYNTRNLTSVRGEVIDFTRANPYAGLRGKPLWAPPEVPSPASLVNPTGAPGNVGNLGLTDQEENDIVSFMRTLSDAHSP